MKSIRARLDSFAAGRRRTRMCAVALAGFLGCVLLSGQGRAQAPGLAGAQVYSTAQLDQMLAPIALYPDDLLGQILMAATYPLEVVQADRWLQNPENASLRGAQLTQALEVQPWDSSVKSLVAFPQILGVMDNNLEWMEDLGEAFISQQPQVMDRVQQLRSRAEAARTLNSTPQQTVVNDGPAIEIAPASPDTVYVPVYDPNVVYGDWPYPDDLPYYFDMPGFALGAFVGFAVVAPLWGWNHWDWHHHWLTINGGPGYPPPPVGTRPPPRPTPWRHDPAHRGQVPYRDTAMQAQFARGAGTIPAPGEFRGYSKVPAFPVPPAAPGFAAERPGAAAPEPFRAIPSTSASTRREEPRRSPGPAMHPSPPAMESFGHGAEVHAQEQRGASSRASAPAASISSSGGGKGRR